MTLSAIPQLFISPPDRGIKSLSFLCDLSVLLLQSPTVIGHPTPFTFRKIIGIALLFIYFCQMWCCSVFLMYCLFTREPLHTSFVSLEDTTAPACPAGNCVLQRNLLSHIFESPPPIFTLNFSSPALNLVSTMLSLALSLLHCPSTRRNCTNRFAKNQSSNNPSKFFTSVSRCSPRTTRPLPSVSSCPETLRQCCKYSDAIAIAKESRLYRYTTMSSKCPNEISPFLKYTDINSCSFLIRFTTQNSIETLRFVVARHTTVLRKKDWKNASQARRYLFQTKCFNLFIGGGNK